MTNRVGSRVTLADGGGRSGRVIAPSSVVPGWVVAWDRSNIRTHEPAEGLIAASRPERIAPARETGRGSQAETLQLELFALPERRRA